MSERFDLTKYSTFSYQKPFNFSKNSSIGCGGLATIVFYPHDVEEWIALIGQLQQDGVRYYLLGNLTNVLPPDGFTDCVIVSTKKVDSIVAGDKLFVYAGVTSARLLSACKQEGRLGAEFLSGIPCTLGGALYMNAGAAGKYMSDIVESVVVLRAGKRIVLPLSDCAYAYKHSLFMDNQDVILGGTFALKKSTYADILEVERFYKTSRAHLPKGKSMGCIFKNPAGQSAGELIEKTGLKNLRVGGAIVSPEHANFIINDGNATAREVRALIKLIQNAVFAYCGVALEEEIQYLD